MIWISSNETCVMVVTPWRNNTNLFWKANIGI